MLNLYSDVDVDRNQNQGQTLKSKGRCLMGRLGVCTTVITLVLMASISIAAEVSIPDPNLEAAIREAIGKPTGPITEEDLQGITSLDASERGIEDLTGLEYCTNLQDLNLPFNQIADITPLSGLSNLQSLSLWENHQIADISPLSGLSNLQRLDIAVNQIADISPLSGLSNLWSLTLGGNQITDISPLSGLSNLRWLDLGDNQITDISPLSGLSNLQNLWLPVNQIADISPLAGLSNLQRLLLGGNQITDISPLSGLTLIGERDKEWWWETDLDLSNNNITDIQPLVDNPGMDNGDVVDLRGNPLSEESLNTLIPLLEARGVIVIEAGEIMVHIPDVSAFHGGTVWIPIQISDVTDREIIASDFAVSYHSEVVQAIGVSTSGTLTETWADSFNVVEGIGTSVDTLKVAMATASDVLSGSGTLIFLGFAVSEGAGIGDGSPLAFEDFIFNEGTPSAQTIDGSVTVALLYGDVTGNGEVRAYDAAWILQHTVGLRTLTGADSIAADVSGEGGIAPYDASLVLQVVVGLISEFPVESAPKLVAGGVRTVRLGAAEMLSEGSFRVPVLIDEWAQVYSGYVELTFDRAQVKAVRAEGSGLPEGYLFAGNISQNSIRFSFAGAQPGYGSGRITEVIFEGDVSDAEDIRLKAVRLNEGRMSVQLGGEPTSSLPETFALHPNFPNPFNPSTTIRYQLPEASNVQLTVYDVTGQLVRTLVEGNMEAGHYVATWNGRDVSGRAVASGVYLSRWTKLTS